MFLIHYLIVYVKLNYFRTSLSKILWQSLQSLKQLPIDTLVLPGHGAGSSCGKSI